MGLKYLNLKTLQELLGVGEHLFHDMKKQNILFHKPCVFNGNRKKKIFCLHFLLKKLKTKTYKTTETKTKPILKTKAYEIKTKAK